MWALSQVMIIWPNSHWTKQGLIPFINGLLCDADDLYTCLMPKDIQSICQILFIFILFVNIYHFCPQLHNLSHSMGLCSSNNSSQLALQSEMNVRAPLPQQRTVGTAILFMVVTKVVDTFTISTMRICSTD